MGCQLDLRLYKLISVHDVDKFEVYLRDSFTSVRSGKVGELVCFLILVAFHSLYAVIARRSPAVVTS